MKALSIRSPWWWYILHAGKDIENRDWPTRFRGRVLVHASKWWKAEEVLLDLNGNPDVRLSDLHPFRGCIVGSVEIVDCVSWHNSQWFVGQYGFVLRNPIAFYVPVACKGALGFFDVPGEIVEACK